MENTITDSKEIVINNLNKQIEQVTAYWKDYGFTAEMAILELERLRELKSVMEILPFSSLKYQKEKLEKEIEILNEQYSVWLVNHIGRKGNPKARTPYNTEVRLNHLRQQLRNLNYLIELSNPENDRQYAGN